MIYRITFDQDQPLNPNTRKKEGVFEGGGLKKNQLKAYVATSIMRPKDALYWFYHFQSI